MDKSSKGTCVARQVELIIRRLNSLSTLPEITAGFLSSVGNGKFDRTVLSEIIESDPALTAKIYSVAYESGIRIEECESISEVLLKLSTALVREAVLSVKVFGSFDADYDPDKGRVPYFKQLWLHSLAVGCCARRLGEIVFGAENGMVAFTAGLVHDIGKLALVEVMPKSFERMVEQAMAESACLCAIEWEHLGLDHAIVGKLLAEKWGFPEDIIFAIWLHHGDTQLVSADMPGALLARVVRLADVIARQCDIGMTGSFDNVGSVSEIIEGMPVSSEQLEVVQSELSGEVSRRCELLGLEAPGGQALYCELVHETAARLARENTELSVRRDEFALGKAQMGFVCEFLPRVSLNKSSIEVASDFAVCWQKHYQTGPVCVYLWQNNEGELVEVATVDESGSVNTAVVNKTSERDLIPAEIKDDFAILEAGKYAGGLFEQLDFDIDLSRSKMALLLVGGKAVGAIVFEHRLPIDVVKQRLIFTVSLSLGASILALVSRRELQSRLSEQFADVLRRVGWMRRELGSSQSLEAVSEMAAGAAHEMNNPLAVISGRAQLLYDAETDENKKQMLSQIQDRTAEISEIVSDLMSFARPKEPVRNTTEVGRLIEAAVERARREKKSGSLEVEFDCLDELGEVYVDAEQITLALSNIILNAFESYEGGEGSVKISGDCVQPERQAVFEIIDEGYGMDGATLTKAAEPFFSAKAAGRQRGMGLAHAKRLLQANGGWIHIKSEPGKGTVVTIGLGRS